MRYWRGCPAQLEGYQVRLAGSTSLRPDFPVNAAKHYLISRAYINDERFKSDYESRQAGLASWLADAIENVAERNGVDLQDPEWESKRAHSCRQTINFARAH